MFVSVDVESDGPIPGKYSMICFGAVLVDFNMETTFYGRLKPISDKWIPEALAVSGFTREETLKFPEPQETMLAFDKWIKTHNTGPARFISDNNGYDWQFINWYLHMYVGANVFGYSSTNLGSLYKGMAMDIRSSFKHLRKTVHSHNPVDDAKGNAEALVEMKKKGLKIYFD